MKINVKNLKYINKMINLIKRVYKLLFKLITIP